MDLDDNDTAGEISYVAWGSGYTAREIVQYTYGFGAVGGGMGWKRVLEFVAFGGSDFRPYYRFLHEDTMGSTIATTNLSGDRIDEYDYTDYGAPLHAPVLLDGRWISNIVALDGSAGNPNYPGVSQVTLSQAPSDPDSLIGCELRVVKSSPSGASDVFVAGTVISWSGTSMRIHDPDYAVATAWGSITAPFRELAAVYDLHEGFFKGVMDSTSTGLYGENGWYRYKPPAQPGGPGQHFYEECTYLHVDHGAFDGVWMFTELPLQPNPPTITLPPGKPLYVEIGPGPGGASDFKSVLVLGVDPASHVSGTTSLFKKLAIQGQNHAGYVGAGKWYRFNNNQNPHRRHATQSGTWAGAATGTGPTTFTTSSNANLTEYMVGWTLQPDINAAVYLTITAVSGSTLNVAGAYASLGGQGKRFRIYAPPGTERFGKAAGTLDRYVAANSSRHLYMGYRYESPAAGVWDDINGTALKRQTGGNFTGLYYTLHRHYDPALMRFTGPDPAASPFHNLHAYCGNNPAGAYDPDGLEIEFTFDGYWGRVKNIFTKGEFEFKLGTDGYSERAGATWEGAAVKTFDTLTLGQVLDDNDRAAMAYKWQSRGLGGYYDAGGFVGSTTVLTALSIATAGAFSGVGATGAVANIGLRSWMAGGAIAGAYGGASDAGIAGGGAAEMLQGAAIGAVIGAGSELLGAVGGRLISRGLHKIGDKLLGKVTPHGFVNSSDFANFTRIFNRGMKKAGYADAKGFLQGSAVTGRSFPRPGRPSQGFDIGRVSDFDVAVASPTLLARAQAAGVPLRTGGIRTAKLWPGNLRALNLDKLQSQLSRYARRRVDVMIYKDAPSVMSMQRPSIPLRR